MLIKTTEISGVFKDRKREEDFVCKHKIGINSFTRVRKLGFGTQLDLGEDVTITNSVYTQARAKR